MKQRKILSILLSISMTVALIAGCTSKTEEMAAITEITEKATSTEAVQTTVAVTTAVIETTEESAEIASADETTDLSIKNAKNFDIEYMADHVKLVTDSDGRKLLLVPEGIDAPSGYADAVQISTPISDAYYTSTTHVGYLGSLEEESLYDSIAAVATPESDWTTPEVLERFTNGQITHIGQEQWSGGDIEAVTTLSPQIVFSGGGDESGVALRAMLDEVNINYAVVTEWTEENNMASLEWIKFFAAFFNLDEEADAVYEAKLAKLDDLYAAAAGIPEEDRPVVAYGLVYDGIVYTQSGDSTLAQEIEKAGAIYALSDLEGGGSVQLGMEEFLDKCRDADILIYGSLPQYCQDKTILLETEPLFSEFKAFQNDQVYIFDQGYYMNSAKIVEKFEDIVAIFHPESMPGHEFIMYQKLPDVGI